MKGLAPPKKGGRLCWTALQKLQLHGAYRIAALLAIVFGWPFWVAEQWRGRLADQIDNEDGR